MIVSNASPLHYLILLEHADILPALYGNVWIPAAVVSELTGPDTPESVREWMANRPTWLTVCADPLEAPEGFPPALHSGEIQAIGLAVEQGVRLVLLDDLSARLEAGRRGLAVAGTLRVLAEAAQLGLLSLPIEFARLQQTNFRASPSLYARILDELKPKT